LKKILFVFGTRPEAIKMAPLVNGFRQHTGQFLVKVCVTAQHREMLDQVLKFFNIQPDYDLNLMRPNQNLYQLTSDIILNLKEVLEDFAPDHILVHGDTTTSTAAALAGFYAGAKIGHVEAGLRTFNKLSPFPEEMNRQLTSKLADYHFAPTAKAAENLYKEGISEKNVVVTGNTVIDALLLASENLADYRDIEIAQLEPVVDNSKKLILVTGHRRENFGQGIENMCNALKRLAERGDVQIIFPVHLNPNIRVAVNKILKDQPDVHLVEPLGYPAFVWLMAKSYLIITDSGGVQEEAPSLGKPVLVTRKDTERPEALATGSVFLVGTDNDLICQKAAMLLDDEALYSRLSKVINPYGDGKATERIIEHFINLK